ncbi:hypothetical protein SH611_17895 [Geminicoccaceae bacterium 1502E]|nr:hypothetical protein [Geminicoccaceae bacterium 1502E]
MEAEVIRAEVMDGRVISEEEARRALLARKAQQTFRQAGERTREGREQEARQEEERRAWLAAGGRP